MPHSFSKKLVSLLSGLDLKPRSCDCTAVKEKKKRSKTAVKIWCYLNVGVFVSKMTQNCNLVGWRILLGISGWCHVLQVGQLANVETTSVQGKR